MLENDRVDDDSSDARLRGYRPHLDGLRALAVYLVVVFHAGLGKFEGGFIGVDVFFVLSGFLVTRVVLTSWTDGEFRLRTFYARRVRRLLPAAVIAVIGISWLWSVVASPAEVLAVSDGFRASLLYFANWFFIAESTDYFASNLEASPVLHFWSLSIEEQFYLVWPLALFGLLTLKNRLRLGDLAIRTVVAVLAVASLAWAIYLARGDLNRAYYGTDARAYQLLGGALLALSPRFFDRFRGRERWATSTSVAALVGLVVVSTWIVEVNPIWRGAFATLITLVLLVALEVGPGPAKAALSLKPMTYLGQISYGTYLWHWPVVLIARQRLDLSPRATFVFAAVVATGVAALSSHLVERPIRDASRLGRFPTPVVASGLVLSLVAALVAVPYLVDPSRVTGRTPPRNEAQAAEPAVGAQRVAASTVDWRAASEDKTGRVVCLDSAPTDCTVVEGSGPHLMLVGDSHAIMLIAPFVKLAIDNDYTLSIAVAYGCSWPEGLNYLHVSQDERDECDAQRTDWYDRLVPTLDPDVIVTSIRAPDDVGRRVPIVGAPDETAASIGAFAGELATKTTERLTADGRKVILLEPIPVAQPSADPIDCLSSAMFVDECSFNASPVSTLELAYRALADNDESVSSVDYDRLACPVFPRCDAVVDGVVVRWDDTHLTKTFALSIADDLATLLRDAISE